ncbi:unannotated protein [freshwater metagenome]|uniref:Unannotated protein n=1 Tax=freshwater metagenome TaxID=449393 RepID=A0A6J7RLX9_9ZZZZ
MALASMPPSVKDETTTASISGTTMANSQGASVACAATLEVGAAKSGQPKAIIPTSEVATMVVMDRGPSLMACDWLMRRPHR